MFDPTADVVEALDGLDENTRIHALSKVFARWPYEWVLATMGPAQRKFYRTATRSDAVTKGD